jgi:hypothetical protein
MRPGPLRGAALGTAAGTPLAAAVAEDEAPAAETVPLSNKVGLVVRVVIDPEPDALLDVAVLTVVDVVAVAAKDGDVLAAC